MVSDLQGVAGRKNAALAMNQTLKGDRPAGRNSAEEERSEWNQNGTFIPLCGMKVLWREVPFGASQPVPNDQVFFVMNVMSCRVNVT